MELFQDLVLGVGDFLFLFCFFPKLFCHYFHCTERNKAYFSKKLKDFMKKAADDVPDFLSRDNISPLHYKCETFIPGEHRFSRLGFQGFIYKVSHINKIRERMFGTERDQKEKDQREGWERRDGG